MRLNQMLVSWNPVEQYHFTVFVFHHQSLWILGFTDSTFDCRTWKLLLQRWRSWTLIKTLLWMIFHASFKKSLLIREPLTYQMDVYVRSLHERHFSAQGWKRTCTDISQIKKLIYFLYHFRSLLHCLNKCHSALFSIRFLGLILLGTCN